jgi:hypothetical protein
MAMMNAAATIELILPPRSCVNDSAERGRKMSSARSHIRSIRSIERANSGSACTSLSGLEDIIRPLGLSD